MLLKGSTHLQYTGTIQTSHRKGPDFFQAGHWQQIGRTQIVDGRVISEYRQNQGSFIRTGSKQAVHRQYAGRTHAGHRQQKDGTHVDYRPNTDSRQAGHS